MSNQIPASLYTTVIVDYSILKKLLLSIIRVRREFEFHVRDLEARGLRAIVIQIFMGRAEE